MFEEIDLQRKVQVTQIYAEFLPNLHISERLNAKQRRQLDRMVQEV